MDVENLVNRARASEDGEAYAPVAKGSGFRIGLGARRGPDREPRVFVEVILDPFPERPRVRPEQLRSDGAHVAWLEGRGYLVTCDADGTITCERSVTPGRAEREVETVRRKLLT